MSQPPRSAADWKARIEAQLVPGMSEPEVVRMMAPRASDRATVPLGGSGAKAVVFRLADGVDAWFQLDGDGGLAAWAVYEQPHAWIKSEGGLLEGDAATPAAPLVFAK